jgi:hypothetical protein
MASSSPYIIVALLLAAIGSISLTAAYAEDGMTKSTSGGSLNIMLEPTWDNSGQAKFKVSFLDPKTNTLHQHQDWDVRILKGSTEVFNTQVVHNVEGTITVPYDFKGNNGDYTVEVNVVAACFPSNPETSNCPINEKSDFNITVTPEFPVGAIGAAMAVLVGTIIVLSRKFNMGLKI